MNCWPVAPKTATIFHDGLITAFGVTVEKKKKRDSSLDSFYQYEQYALIFTGSSSTF
jgi:hypothetical protein